MLRSNSPITLSLPPFRGVTRRIVLLAAAVFLLFTGVGLFLPSLIANLLDLIVLKPHLAAHGLIWLFVTYSFAPMGFLSELFALLSIWFFGAMLEDEFGSRWLGEFFLIATGGGALLATLLSYAAAARIPALDPSSATAGMWPAVLAVLLAFARFHPNDELRVYFVIPVKAKYLAAAYMLFYLVVALLGGDRFGALTAICVALSGYGYLRLAPRRGMRFAASEKWFGIRNAYLRSKRRRAGKKFAVYMKKQGQQVNIDSEGRYIDPSGTPRDPNDRRWMN